VHHLVFPQVQRFVFAQATQSQQSYRLLIATFITESSDGMEAITQFSRWVSAPHISRARWDRACFRLVKY